MRNEICADNVETEKSEEQRKRKIGDKPPAGLKPEAKAAQPDPDPPGHSPATKRL